VRILRIASGFVLLAVGVVLLVLPGPGWLTIALALAILAVDFAWARRLHERLRNRVSRVSDAVRDAARRRRNTRE
jgi:uncharacterized protein (TIGR02611 family)